MYVWVVSKRDNVSIICYNLQYLFIGYDYFNSFLSEEVKKLHINLYYFKDKKIWGFIIINFFIGIYISLIRLKYPPSLYLDDLYFYAREGLAFDIEAENFDIQTFLSILNTIISIPIVCGQFSKSYATKRCYVASRFKTYYLFYINEIVNIAALCFVLSAFYSIGMCSFCATVSNLELHNSSFYFTYLISVLNSALLLFAFCILVIPFCIQNDKAAILSDIILFVTCTIVSYYLPVKYKYFDIIMIYFVNTLFQNNKYISTNSIICYSVTFITIVAAIILGNNLLKRKDAL